MTWSCLSSNWTTLSLVQISLYILPHSSQLQQLIMIGNPPCSAQCHPGQEQPLWLFLGMVSSLSTSFPPPILSIIVNLKWRMSLRTTTMPHQSCWPEDLPFPEAVSPRTSLSRAVIIFGCCGTHEKKCCIFCIHIYFVCLVPDVHQGSLWGDHDFVRTVDYILRIGVKRSNEVEFGYYSLHNLLIL